MNDYNTHVFQSHQSKISSGAPQNIKTAPMTVKAMNKGLFVTQKVPLETNLSPPPPKHSRKIVKQNLSANKN
jgi:hypothetical protein